METTDDTAAKVADAWRILDSPYDEVCQVCEIEGCPNLDRSSPDGCAIESAKTTIRERLTALADDNDRLRTRCQSCGSRSELVNAAWRVVDEAKGQAEESDFMDVDKQHVLALEAALVAVTPEAGYYLEDTDHYVPKEQYDRLRAQVERLERELEEFDRYVLGVWGLGGSPAVNAQTIAMEAVRRATAHTEGSESDVQ